MPKAIKQLLSLSVISIFLLFAVASKVNHLHYGAFNYSNKVEDKSDKGYYIEMNDGTKIYGEKIKWKSGLLVKDQIAIDDQKFKITEVRGYRLDHYYGRLGKSYIQRIVHGKINVYVDFTPVTTTSTDHNGYVRTRTYTRTDQYAQVGDGGEMVPFGDRKDIIKLVRDCPLSVGMIDKKGSKIRKAIRKDRSYLNKVFEVYNNDCKPVD